MKGLNTGSPVGLISTYYFLQLIPIYCSYVFQVDLEYVGTPTKYTTENHLFLLPSSAGAVAKDLLATYLRITLLALSLYDVRFQDIEK